MQDQAGLELGDDPIQSGEVSGGAAVFLVHASDLMAQRGQGECDPAADEALVAADEDSHGRQTACQRWFMVWRIELLAWALALRPISRRRSGFLASRLMYFRHSWSLFTK